MLTTTIQSTYQAVSAKGQANGYASLDSNGLVPANQIPGFTNDVLTFDSITDFPTVGEEGILYIANDTKLQYLWSGTAYAIVSPSLALGETSSTAYAGDKGKANAENIALLQSSKVDKVTGKGLSTEDYTTDEKNKLTQIKKRY